MVAPVARRPRHRSRGSLVAAASLPDTHSETGRGSGVSAAPLQAVGSADELDTHRCARVDSAQNPGLSPSQPARVDRSANRAGDPALRTSSTWRADPSRHQEGPARSRPEAAGRRTAAATSNTGASATRTCTAPSMITLLDSGPAPTPGSNTRACPSTRSCPTTDRTLNRPGFHACSGARDSASSAGRG